MFQNTAKLILVGFLGLSALAITPALPVSAAGGTAASTGAAHRGRGASGFITNLQTRVGLTPEQIDAVRGILADQRQQSAAIREKSDAKIRAVLTGEQQPKFDAFLAELKARHTQATSQRS